MLLINRRNAAVMREGPGGAGLPADHEHEVLGNGHPATVLIGSRAPVEPAARPVSAREVHRTS